MAWTALVASLIPILYNMFAGDNDMDEQMSAQSNSNISSMSAAEAAEFKRISEHNQAMRDRLEGRYANPTGQDPSVFQGDNKGAWAANSAGYQQSLDLERLMSMNGTLGSSITGGEANRQYLGDQADTQAAGGAVNTLVNGLLDFADTKLAKQPADGNYTSPGYEGAGAAPGAGVNPLTGLPMNPYEDPSNPGASTGQGF